MAAKLRAAIYTRLSRDRDGSTSIERQLAECRRLCASRGYEVVHESTCDVDVSGGKLIRPGLDEVRQLYGELDAVVFWKLDRLSRSLRDFLDLAHEAETHDVALISATEPIDLSTPIGQAMVSVMATFAELERRTVGIRTASAISHLRRVGRISGGRQPYGYKGVPAPDGQGFVREVDEPQAEAVRLMVDAVLSGESRLSVARTLNEGGVETPKGGAHWTSDAVGDVLRNPALWGATVLRGQILRGDDGMPLVTAAIIDRETWDAVQVVLSARSGYGERMATRRTGLLSGLLVCADCGAGLRRGRSGQRYETYHCPTKSRSGQCAGCSISASRLEEYVIGRFLDKYGPWSIGATDHAAALAQEAEEAREHEAAEELRNVDRALADLETDRYELHLFDDEAGRQRYASMSRRLSERRAAIVSEMGRGTVSPGQGPSEGLSESPAAAPRMTVAAWWPDATLNERRDLLRGLVGRITVAKGRQGVKGLDPSRVSFEKGITAR